MILKKQKLDYSCMLENARKSARLTNSRFILIAKWGEWLSYPKYFIIPVDTFQEIYSYCRDFEAYPGITFRIIKFKRNRIKQLKLFNLKKREKK
jgi:hypothetical protein